MPHDLQRWNARRFRRDLLLGGGLVAVYAVSLFATVDTLGTATVQERAATKLVSAIVAVVAAALLWGLWARAGRRNLLILFPLLICVGSASLAATTTGVASTFTGFFSLAMIYAGLSVRRRLVGVLMAFVAACWLAAQDSVSASSYVRLAVLVAVWTASGLALAAYAGRDRAEAAEWVTRANQDALTGLASKRPLSELIDRTLRADRSAVLLLIDLDGFKNVNDLFGHAAGDAVLIETARRMRGVVRPTDVLARLGGDEFAVLLFGVDSVAAESIADRLRVRLADPVELPQGRMAVTASIGTTDLRNVGSAEQAIREADSAMYDAKRTGKNQVAAYRSDLASPNNTVAPPVDLVGALERRELELYYQPIVHLHAGHVVGVEALVRWNHPERGLLTPAAFFSGSHDTSATVALNEWVLSTACAQGAAWQPADDGGVLIVAVNVSAPEMLAPGFVERVVRILNSSGLPPQLLVLEITEALVLSDAPLIRERIDLLRRIGIRIAIDDFGTGRSSLAELRALPADIIKIAPTFTQALDVDTNAASMVRAINAIADALDLDVIVEGVETASQRAQLVELGCQLAQGYHLARPQTAGETATLVTRSVGAAVRRDLHRARD